MSYYAVNIEEPWLEIECSFYENRYLRNAILACLTISLACYTGSYMLLSVSKFLGFLVSLLTLLTLIPIYKYARAIFYKSKYQVNLETGEIFEQQDKFSLKGLIQSQRILRANINDYRRISRYYMSAGKGAPIPAGIALHKFDHSFFILARNITEKDTEKLYLFLKNRFELQEV